MLARKGKQLLVHDWQGFTFPGIVISVLHLWVMSGSRYLSESLRWIVAVNDIHAILD